MIYKGIKALESLPEKEEEFIRVLTYNSFLGARGGSSAKEFCSAWKASNFEFKDGDINARNTFLQNWCSETYVETQQLIKGTRADIGAIHEAVFALPNGEGLPAELETAGYSCNYFDSPHRSAKVGEGLILFARQEIEQVLMPKVLPSDQRSKTVFGSAGSQQKALDINIIGGRYSLDSKNRESQIMEMAKEIDEKQRTLLFFDTNDGFQDDIEPVLGDRFEFISPRTYPAFLPIPFLRLDKIGFSKHFEFVRSFVIKLSSDHLAVVADLKLIS